MPFLSLLKAVLRTRPAAAPADAAGGAVVTVPATGLAALPAGDVVPAATALSRRAPSARLVALIVAAALFMEQLDITVLATALPDMARTFGVDPLHMNVALTSYLLSLAVFIPASGKIADRYGSRTVFRGAIFLFTLGSILCAQAPTLTLLVVARVVQGIGGAMMVPVGRLVLLRAVAKSELVAAMAWLMVPATVGPLVGPPLGGLLVTTLSWHWIFYINVPIGVLGMVLVSRYIPELRELRPGRFDAVGLVFSGVSLSCLMFGFELASRDAVSLPVGAAIIGTGLAAGAGYFHHARRTADPVLDFSLMRIATFRLSVLGGALTRISAGALPFLLPMMLQLGFGMSAARSGAITFMTAVGSLLVRLCSTRVLRWFGFRSVMIWNGLLAVASFYAISAFTPAWPRVALYGVLLAGGFCQSLQFIAYNTIAYADIPRARMSAATSFYSTFQQLMLTLGICVAAASLAGAMAVQGHAQSQLSDFSWAFVVVATISLAASPTCSRLERDAGSELSGRG